MDEIKMPSLDLFGMTKVVKKEKKSKPERKAIPKAVKVRLWEIYFGSKMTGQCYVCNRKKIFRDDFEAAHNVSVAFGGTNNIKNLRPTCKSCNRGIGSNNLEDFRKEWF